MDLVTRVGKGRYVYILFTGCVVLLGYGYNCLSAEQNTVTMIPYHAGYGVGDSSGQWGVAGEHRNEQGILLQAGPPRTDHTHGGKVGRVSDALIMGGGKLGVFTYHIQVFTYHIDFLKFFFLS